MAEEKLINVASTSVIPLSLQEPLPDEYREKPGEAPPLRSVVIRGKDHPDGPEVVTRGVNADVFGRWMDANKSHPVVLNGLLREVSDDDADALDNPETTFGFEPGLKAAADDKDNVKAAEAGTEPVENPTAPEVPEAPKEPPHAVETVEQPTHDGMSDAEMERATRPGAPVEKPVAESAKA